LGSILQRAVRCLPLLLLFAAPAWAQVAETPAIAERRDIPLAPPAPGATHAMTLRLAHFTGDSWRPETITAAVALAAAILAQCGVAVERAELLRIDAPERLHIFFTPASRELARALPLDKPTVYFAAGTRQRPAFDAEAIGLGNSRTRPELAHTVWIVPGARDLPITIAHELAHVLMDSGEHSEEPGNLMRDETAPENTRLTAAQCRQLREQGSANGLVRPSR
jgi:hypothetical protein